MVSSLDELYMQRCLDLALLGQGYTSPNPMVGSVIVYKDRILGEGWHHASGMPHAEIEALAQVRDEDRHLISESTLYVNLEPCSHYGKTPPCCRRIAIEKPKRVVIGMMDPSKKVSGAGIQHLLENNIEVVVGVLEERCRALNKVFVINHTLHRPYITLKWAMSADGFLAHKNSEGIVKQIVLSDLLRQREVHRLRAYHDAILIGGNTARIDNPQLTNRLFWGKSPLRMILSKGISENEAPQTFSGNTPTRIVSLAEGARLSLEDIQKWYHEEGISSVLVEGGQETLQTFIDLDLFDAVEIEISKKRLTCGVDAPKIDFRSLSLDRLIGK